MAEPHVTVRATIDVHAPRERVWDVTQDYARRPGWDRSVESAEVLSTSPRRVRVRLARTGSATFEYVLDRRPERTSLRMVDVDSAWVAGGGGSWDYEAIASGTRWTQTNTLILRGAWRVLAPLVRWQVANATRRAMRRAKTLIEDEVRST